jgi:long-chain acyl-CoA synthetase
MSETPWLTHYDADVRRSLEPYPDKTLLDYLAPLARDHGPSTALLFKGASVSYARLAAESDAFAAGLASLGVGRGDRVALLLPNCPQFFIAEFGAWKAGAVVVPLNPTYTERELEVALNATAAAAVVTLTPFYATVKKIQPNTAVQRVIATSIKEYLPRALRLLFTLFREKQGGHRIALVTGDLRLQGLLRQFRRAPPPGVTVRPDDRAVILSSGGTTGTPKGVVGRHRDYVLAGLQLYEWTKSAKRPWVDAIMLPLPLFHVYANVGVQPLAFIGPNPVSLVPNPRDIDDLLKTIRQVKPAFFNGVPTLYAAIHQVVLLGRGRPDGGNEAAVRGVDGRQAGRRVFADRGHDGMLRQPSTRHQQDRIDRPSAPGCGSADRRRRGSRPGVTPRQGRRTVTACAAADGRVLERPGRDGRDPPDTRLRPTLDTHRGPRANG